MLKIAGNAHYTFSFPANISTAMTFFEDMERLVSYLPLISYVGELDENEYRLLYNATEMEAYHIRIYVDVCTKMVHEEGRLLLLPTIEHKPIPNQATFNAATGQGEYASEVLFSQNGDGETKVDFRLELKAALSRPKGLRFMPASVVNALANNITNRRIEEIAKGFIANSLAAFPEWTPE